MKDIQYHLSVKGCCAIKSAEIDLPEVTVLSMFRRIQLEEEGSCLRQYVILDTNGFGTRYSRLFEGEGVVVEK